MVPIVMHRHLSCHSIGPAVAGSRLQRDLSSESFANSLAEQHVRAITRVISVVLRLLAIPTWSVIQGWLLLKYLAAFRTRI